MTQKYKPLLAPAIVHPIQKLSASYLGNDGGLRRYHGEPFNVFIYFTISLDIQVIVNMPVFEEA